MLPQTLVQTVLGGREVPRLLSGPPSAPSASAPGSDPPKAARLAGSAARTAASVQRDLHAVGGISARWKTNGDHVDVPCAYAASALVSARHALD